MHKTEGYFNSTMVRLKETASSAQSPPLFHFNSTMVRLKEYASNNVSHSKPDFNSTMVRLKVVIVISFSAFQSNFNSTMVRLKELQGDTNSNKLLFQFHYGTIKRRRRKYILCFPLISIPLWYD